MDIAKILEYQKLDFVIYKADRDYVNSEENKKFTKIRMTINDVAENIVRLDKEAADIFADIEKHKNSLENYIKKSKTTQVSGAKNLEQMDKLEDNISSLENELAGIDKDLQRGFKRLQEISREAAELTQKLLKLKAELKNADIARANKRAEIIDSIKEEGKKLTDMKATLVPDDLNIYNKARMAKVKMPIVVPYNDGHCGACGMDIKAEVDGRLQKSGDIAGCPHCRRIVYKK